jgi:Ger(x)C family germination protein
MKKSLLIVIAVLLVFTTGCFDYRDMNKIFFSTLAIYDKDKKGNIVLYSENFKAYRGGGEQSGTEKRVVFRGTGKTLFNAFFDMSKSTGYPLEYSQSKALIYTERTAKNGMKDFLDATFRNQKINLRRYIFVYSGKPEELLKIKIEDEDFIGLFLENLMLSQGKIVNIIRLRSDDLAYKRLDGSGVYIVPIIRKVHEPLKDRIEISKAAVFKDDKMVSKLNNTEVVAYNFLIDDAKKGNILAENPEHTGDLISLDILSNNVKNSISYDGNKIYAKRKINTKVSIQGVQGSIRLTKDIRKKISEDAEKRIKKDCEAFFNKYKEKGIDILNTQRDLEIKYHNVNTKDILDKTELNVEVKVFIEGSQNTTDFY